MTVRLKAPERRARIEEAAEEVFATHGYQGASLGLIAASAGISKPVIYDHFGSKRELHLALLEKTRDALLAFQAEQVSGETFEERIRSMLNAYFDYVERHPYAARMLFRETTGDPEVVAAHRAVIAEADRRIGSALRAEGIANPDVAAVLLRNGIDGLSVWLSDNPEWPRDEARATAIELVLGALAR
ncbi:MAG: TetR/AcrR family transcriptional regulator [Thermoleophilaceae bacterium]|nr:TetR/AcrR family transcriptional regulator [Thermoleophilaceae bacterium]